MLYEGMMHYLKLTQSKTNFAIVTKERERILESVSWWLFCLILPFTRSNFFKADDFGVNCHV